MDYNRIASNVAKKLAKYGQDVTLRQYPEGAGVYDPGTLTVSNSALTPVESTRKALTTDQPGTRIGPQYGTNTKADTLIQDGEKWIYMDALGPRPNPNDKIVVKGVEYVVADAQETSPGGVDLMYLVVLRR